jgi:hypothetical protein
MTTQEITVDLRTKLISPSLQIWRLFPGIGYRLLPNFTGQNVVFLDMPALPLPDGPVDDTTTDLAQRILVSRAWRRWIIGDQWSSLMGTTEKASPSRNPRDYEDVRQPASMGSHRGAVTGLFGRAQKGDLVIVPTALSTRRVLVGEFLTGPETRVSVEIDRYGKETIPARRVRWFPPINELELPHRISEVIRRPNPFVAFDRTLYEDIFDRTFGTYFYENGGKISARFDTKSEHFQASDALDFSVMSEATARMVEFLDTKSTVEIISLIAAAVAPRSPSYQTEMSVNINSPGAFLLKAGQITPLVLSVLLAVAGEAGAADGANPPQVRVINSGSTEGDDPCTAQVDERVRSLLNMMGMEAWREACQRSRRLRENPRLEGTARVVSEPQPRREDEARR